jgi:hypothetical protein
MKNLKRIVYHIAGNDYESFDSLTIRVNLQYVSIENVKKLVKELMLKISPAGKTISDYPFNLKPFNLTGHAENIYLFLSKIGFKDHSEVRDSINIRNTELRMPTRRGIRYLGISCYDPILHTWELKSNSPKSINGRQSIINGKLWRKYYDNNKIS